MKPHSRFARSLPEVLRRVPHPVLREMLNAVQGYGADEQVEDVKNSATG